MNPFEMVVMIILIVTIGKVISTRLGGGGGVTLSKRDARRVARGELVLPPPPGSVSAAEADRMKNEITRLNDRLAVLERIATDPAKRLSDEIDSLKSK